MRRIFIALLIWSAVGLSFASASQAFSGQITKAWANTNWTTGKIAGSVTWDQCSPGKLCDWSVSVTLQPATPDYTCRGDEGLDSDPNTQPFPIGAKKETTNGTVRFDNESQIIQGLFGQRVCVTVIATERRPTPCLFPGPNGCPLYDFIRTEAIASRVMQVGSEPGKPKSIAAARRIAIARTAAVYGIKWTRGTQKRVKCSATPALVRCTATWKYRGQRFQAVNAVRR
jgi:hypothetical protein